MTRLRANLALVRDVLVLTARRKLLGIFLVLGTAVVCVSVFGAELVTIPAAQGPPDTPIVDNTDPRPPSYAIEFFGLDLWAHSRASKEVARVSLVLNHYGIVLLGVPLVSLFGVALGVLATLTAVSSAFEPGRAELILPRPLSRAEIAVSRFTGVLAFGLVQGGWVSLLLFVLTGFKFGVWWPKLLLLGPALLLKYAVVASLCTCVLVVTRSRVLALAATALTWVASYSINLSLLSAREAGEGSVMHGLLPQLTWLQRLFPQIPHQDFLAAGIFGQDLEVSAAQVLLQATVWTLLPLLITTFVVSRRDY